MSSAAEKIILFLSEKREFKGGSSRVVIMHMLEIVYRGKGPHVTDQVVKEMLRYGKEVEQLSELDFIHAIQKHLYLDEPISFPLENPEYILLPNGEAVWRKKT